MKRIFLITPPKNREESLIMGFKWTVPHIGLGYIASYINQFNYETKIFDLNYVNLKKFIQIIRKERPDAIGITATTEEFYGVKRILAIIKKINPNIYTILGGPHATALPERTLINLPQLDFVVIGEGEYTFKNLLDYLFLKNNIEAINGIAYRINNKIQVKPIIRLINDLDSLPYPSWNKFDLKNYTSFSEGFSKHYLELPIITQRGCPFKCVFCQKMMGNIIRKRSINNIIEEIKYNLEKYNIERIAINDETFSIEKNRILEFCKKFREEGLHKKITWSCFTRVNLLDEELVKNLKVSGCRLISFGIESGNQYILNEIKKGIYLKDAENAIKLTKKYQIETHYGMIYGHPFETFQSMRDTLKFSLKNRPDLITYAILVPYPGTKIYEYAKTHYGGIKCIASN